MDSNREESIDERVDSVNNNNQEIVVKQNTFDIQSAESSHYSPTSNSNCSKEIETPGGSRYWLPYIEDDDKPIKGKNYGTYEECLKMYSEYAAKSGFDPKLSSSKKTTKGEIKSKYVRCNKHGNPPNINIDTLNPVNSDKLKRNSNLQVTRCEAHVMFKIIDGTSTYRLHNFVEQHNHPLNPLEYRHLSKQNRKIDYPEQIFMHHVSKSNFGSTIAHQLYSNLKGGYQYVNGTQVDFKNYKRDLNVFIGESDAQMLVNKLTNRAEYVPHFSFSYDIKNSELVSFFWADATAKANYKEFGDIISFDATYRTNRYSMIFVPFTAIDNHKKCVTIGAAMLANETTETYIWLLKAFLDAFKKQPRIILTDQDPSMKRAVATVLTETKHRLCMWHIVTKFTVKIDKTIMDHTNFKSRLSQLIWNVYHKPEIFEKKWLSLMEEFDLQENVWLKKLFDIRSTWIPAYFIDYEMCGLMRTTSRSESENSFFQNFTSYGSTLINFMNLFESAMEKQRHVQEFLDHQTISKTPRLKTPLKIEEHANRVYTRSIFFLVQEEIHASVWLCSQTSVSSEEGYDIILINERAGNKQKKDQENQKGKRKGKEENDIETFSEIAATEIMLEIKKEATYKVKHNKGEDTYECSCNHFVRCGILCRHIFCVFKNRDIEEIPKKYISRRWEKDIIPPAVRSKTHRYEGQLTEKCQKLANEASRSVESCIVVLRNDEEKLSYYVEKLKKLKIEVEKNVTKKKKNEIMEEILGIKKPNQIEIQNPKGIRNKGSGSNIRMQGYGEKAKKQNERPYRLCGICKLMVNDHDRRTCTKVQGDNPIVQENTARQTRGKKVVTQAYKDLSDEDSDYLTLGIQKKKQKNARGKAIDTQADDDCGDEDSDYAASGVGI